MKVDIVTIFPEYLSPLELSLIGRARTAGALDVAVHDLRQWTHDVHRTVDDTPYGGGPGMVMRPEPWGEALDALTAAHSGPPGRLVVPSPAGVPFTQALAVELAAEERLIFACGRYEGIDQRVLEDAARRMPVLELSLGDYVLFGGEVAVLVIMEAVVRLLPGVLGNADSLVEESHTGGLLEAPVYTKPPTWRDLPVPEILRSGDHARIARWRRDQAVARTAARRPDLLAGPGAPALDQRDRDVLRDTGFQISPGDMAE
jgi:tRNA (guanine37-N1)-methyltransferase